MRDQTDSRTLPLSPGVPGIEVTELFPVQPKPWLPFVVHHGERLIGVYWGADAKEAAAFARMESRSFGPVDLTGKRLTVAAHVAGVLPLPTPPVQRA